MKRWARVVADLLVPGGLLYLNEFHPFMEVFGMDSLEVEYDYFGRPEGYAFDDGATYVETDDRTPHTRSFEWIHSLSEVLGALLEAGLQIEALR